MASKTKEDLEKELESLQHELEERQRRHAQQRKSQSPSLKVQSHASPIATEKPDGNTKPESTHARDTNGYNKATSAPETPLSREREIANERLRQRLGRITQLADDPTTHSLPGSPTANGSSLYTGLEENQKRLATKETGVEAEFQELQERLMKRADEKLEWERTKLRLQSQLEESRDEAQSLRRKVRALETELLETKSLLNQARHESTTREEEMHSLQKKVPQLMRRAEEAVAQVESLKRERDELRAERDSIRSESSLMRQQDANVKSELEQSNVRLLNEIFALNTRLTEAMLQASELRGEVGRREEIIKKEKNSKESSESTIKKMQAEISRLQDEVKRLRENDSKLQTSKDTIEEEKERWERETKRLKEITSNMEKEYAEERRGYQQTTQLLEQELEGERKLRRKLEEVNEDFEGQFVALKEKLQTRLLSPTQPISPSVKLVDPSTPISASPPSKTKKTVRLKEIEDENDEFDKAQGKEETREIQVNSKRVIEYNPAKDDEIDNFLADELNSASAGGLEFLPPNFSRITRGVYQFGSRRINIHLQGDKPVVRVGGGFTGFIPFVQKYGKLECIKVSKADQSPHQHSSSSRSPNTKSPNTKSPVSKSPTAKSKTNSGTIRK